ncbi:MAG: hypothetical protein C4345_01970, partial [Chloroflexota bacterium]
MTHHDASPLPRLSSRAEFDAFVAQAKARWDALWNGNQTIVSVGVGSSSIAKGALEVLAACEEA